MLTEAVANFIIKDMLPVSTVDGEGFVSLMEVAEPRYSVPCRRTIMNLIDQKFLLMKQQMKSKLRNLSYLSLTTDMWTSQPGDGYISSTTQYVTAEFAPQPYYIPITRYT